MSKSEEQKYNKIEIKAMLKLIPNGIAVGAEDLEEIYSQNDIR